jgi:Nitrous oxide-stimulated promoter
MTEPQKTPQRLARERQTIAAMLELYCRDHHHPPKGPCEDCMSLLNYAFCRLDRCPFGTDKPTCAKCPIHCYKPAMRARIQEVMRYAGPRMILRHPLLSLLHQFDSLRGRPARPTR